MDTVVMGFFKQEDNFVEKISAAVINYMKDNGIKAGLYPQDSFKDIENPEFIIVKISSYGVKQLKQLKKERPEAYCYRSAIDYLIDRDKKPKEE